MIVELQDRNKIDFELGEWIHKEQIAHAKRREKLGEAIELALGDQGKNSSQYFDLVRLSPAGEYFDFVQLIPIPLRKMFGI